LGGLSPSEKVLQNRTNPTPFRTKADRVKSTEKYKKNRSHENGIKRLKLETGEGEIRVRLTG